MLLSNGVEFPEHESVVIRTDFSDDRAWEAVLEAARRPEDIGGGLFARARLTPIDDRRFEGVTVAELEILLPESPPYYLFVVDHRTIVDPEHPLLVLDTSRDHAPGFLAFRAVPDTVVSIENNLSLANMDFEDFSDEVDADGIHRGFRGARIEP